MASRPRADVLRLPEQTNPPAPPAGQRIIYPRSDGQVYSEDSSGFERLMTHAIEAYAFNVSGTVTTLVGTSRIYLEGNYVVETVRIAVNTAPTGGPLTVDVNKNGTTIYTTQANRPSIAASAFTATGNSPDVTTFAAGDYLSIDVDLVGTTIPGSNLTVIVRLRKVA